MDAVAAVTAWESLAVNDAIGAYKYIIRVYKYSSIAPMYLNKGQCLYQLGKYKDAIENFKLGEEFDSSLTYHLADKAKAYDALDKKNKK